MLLVIALSIGETKMLEGKQLVTLWGEIHPASRIGANTRKPKTEQQEEEARLRFTQ